MSDERKGKPANQRDAYGGRNEEFPPLVNKLSKKDIYKPKVVFRKFVCNWNQYLKKYFRDM